MKRQGKFEHDNDTFGKVQNKSKQQKNEYIPSMYCSIVH